MALFSTRLVLALVVAAAALTAPAALAATPLPEQRTHVDASDAPAVQAGEDADEAPRLTLLASDTDASDVRRGYLYIKARCSKRCEIEVTAKTRIRGKMRQIASTSRELPARRTRRIRMRIRSDVRRRIAAGARFVFRAVPYPPS